MRSRLKIALRLLEECRRELVLLREIVTGPDPKLLARIEAFLRERPLSEDRLWAVDPGLAAAFRRVAGEFADSLPGSTLSVAQGFRTPAMQVSASTKGLSPFNSATSWSLHQSFPALALDFAVIGSGAYVSDGTDERYTWVGERFEALGFTWGGRFKHPRPDPDHVQVAGAHGPRSAQEAADALKAYQAALAARPVTA